MSSKISFSQHKIAVLDPRPQLSRIQLSLIQLQTQLKKNPSEFAKTARKTVQALSSEFESLASVSMAPRNSSLRLSYDLVQAEFAKIQEQLKNIPKLQSQSTICFECVIL